MMMKTRDELVKDIAFEIVNDENYSNVEWDSVSVAIRFEPPSIMKGGYLYVGEQEPIRKNPGSMELTTKVAALRDLMAEEDSKKWLACLIKISAKTQEIDIDFEYENVRRWYLTPTMDLAEIKAYALSLK